MSEARFTPARNLEQELAGTPEMSRYMADVAEVAADEVSSKAAVDTGALRDSVSGDVERTSEGYEAQLKVGNRRAFYWHIVEWDQTPFVRPGLQATLTRFGGHFK